MTSPSDYLVFSDVATVLPREISIRGTKIPEGTRFQITGRLRILHLVGGNSEDTAEEIASAMAKRDPNMLVIYGKEGEMKMTIFEEGYDLVCASRYMPGGQRLGGPPLQGFFSRYVCSSLMKLTGIRTHDVSNAFKMYRTEILRTTPLEEAGFASSLEICVKAFLKGYRITEVPTTWRGRTAGTSSFKMLKVARSYFRWYLWAVLLRNHRF